MRTLACALGVGLLTFFAQAQSRRITADDMTKVVRISDPRMSPDGRTVAIVVSRANLKDDAWDAEIDFADVASHRLKVMTHDRVGAHSVRWSPTGDRIAYLAQDAEKKTQIFVLPVDGGDSMQITHSRTSIGLLAWKPDGTALAYAAPDEQPEKKDEAKYEDGFEVGNNNYTERSRAMPVHLWLVPAAGGDAKRLTSGEWSLPVELPPNGPPSQIAFTPDGKSLVFVKADSPITGDSTSKRVAVLDVATGSIRLLTHDRTEESDPVLSPDGSTVAFQYPLDGNRANYDAAYTAPVAGGAATNATADLDHDIAVSEWMPDSHALVVEASDGTRSALWVQAIGGVAQRVELGDLSVSGGVSAGKEGSLAFAATSPGRPAELFYVAHAGAAPVQLTNLQTITDGVAVARQETLHWKSDGFDVDGVLTYPPDYAAGKKYPLVLYIHGGPTSASLATFTLPAQIFAAQGWLVFEPNYRGSNSEGNAFQAAIVRDSGAGPGRDVMAGVKALEARGIVDESRIAVGGWSYGGYMTSWLIGNYPSVWRCAVAGAPVTDLVDQYTLSDNNIQRSAHYGPSPFVGENLESYRVQSPIDYAWRVKAPTLIMSDVGDWRVTTTQAYKLFHALKDNNVPVKFIAYPVPGHSPADPIRVRDVFRRWTAWYAQYLNAGSQGLLPLSGRQ
ncbi:MAG TPA: S9 family peptidase [Acidobacteriaceae bacterium]|nr:S9 family peptidase [Acidobacteriaceae bacterium]